MLTWHLHAKISNGQCIINIPKSNRHFNTSAENRELSLRRKIKECKRKHSENSDDKSESYGEVPYKEHYMYGTGPDHVCAQDDIHGDTSNQRKGKSWTGPQMTRPQKRAAGGQ